MARISFYLLLVFLAGFISNTFFAGLVGGTLLVSLAPCLALFFLTRVSLRLPAVWIVLSALVLEFFSYFPFGMHAVAFVCAAVFLRTMLLTIVTHRSLIALTLTGMATAVLYTLALGLLHLAVRTLFHIPPFLTFSSLVQIAFWNSVLFACYTVLGSFSISRFVYGTA